MENEVFTPLLKKFTRSPLVTWVRTFGPLAEENGTSLEEYMTLVDGVFLNEVMLQISHVVGGRETLEQSRCSHLLRRWGNNVQTL
uniref:Uncharacterized protein n=1 Tax=Meleagris gallopavo TaxID=9103 RepID=A0A803Y5W7_MELGA